MKKKLKKWLRPVLFTLGGASPVNTILYMGLMGWLLSGIFGSQSA